MSARQIVSTRRARPTRDGDGVAIERIAGMRDAALDPFLMLDELRARNHSDVGGGFPPHPHRGIQTLTYMKQGALRHRDGEGNSGVVRSGGAQWMSAGRGIIHSELPTPDTAGLHGFQLWVNLPRVAKMSAPDYRDLAATEMTAFSASDMAVTVIAGAWHFEGAPPMCGPLKTLAANSAVADLSLPAGGSARVNVDEDEALLAYVYSGRLATSAGVIGRGHLAITGPGSYWCPHAADEGAEVLLLRGRPLREPVAHYGPFVMNTPEEIERAVQDYRDGRLAAAIT